MAKTMTKSQEQFTEEVEGVLEVVRQGLAFHNGSVELVSADPVTGRVEVRFQGNCVGCSMADFTFKAGVEEVLFEMLPEVREVVLAPPQESIEKPSSDA
jgi:Fe-S cluster biogenesis protein NfuA